MIGLVRKATLLGACGTLMASVAVAAEPDAAFSTVPKYIIASGVRTTTDSTPDGGSAITIVVRDVIGNPIVGSKVELNYTLCNDTKLCTAVISGIEVDCSSPNRVVRAQTGLGGLLTLSILGASNHTGAVPPLQFPGAGADCITIYAYGVPPTGPVLLGHATSVIYDLDGARDFPANNGLKGADLSYVVNDIGTSPYNPYVGRTDYSGDGKVDGADVSYLIPALGRAAAGLGSGGGCWGTGPLGTNTAQPYCP